MKEVMQEILYVVITVIIPIIVYYAANYMLAKTNEVTEKISNEKEAALIEQAVSTIGDIVIKINQTYVDSLKSSGNFSKDAQEKAKSTARIEAVKLISQEAKDVIKDVYTSFDTWLDVQIEKAVNEEKSYL